MKLFFAGLTIVAFTLSLIGCSTRESETAKQAAARGAPTDVYHVRAQIDMVPIAGKPTTELILHHEAIPTFKRPNGKLGMASMSMPFPVSKSVPLNDFVVGDKVEVELAVWSKPGERFYEIEKMTKLPADTQLDFGAKPTAPKKP